MTQQEKIDKAVDAIKRLSSVPPYSMGERQKAQKVFEAVGAILTDYRQDYEVRANGRALLALAKQWERTRQPDDYKALRVLSLKYIPVVQAGAPRLDPFTWEGFFTSIMDGLFDDTARRYERR